MFELLLAVVLDLFSRKVVGWAMATNLETPLVLKALDMPRVARRPKAGLIQHSDRGSQYASADHGRGVGGTRHSAVHEPQGKLLGQRRNGDLRCNAEGRQLGGYRPADPRGRPPAVFDWLMFYKRTRMHPSAKYVSPKELEYAAIKLILAS